MSYRRLVRPSMSAAVGVLLSSGCTSDSISSKPASELDASAPSSEAARGETHLVSTAVSTAEVGPDSEHPTSTVEISTSSRDAALSSAGNDGGSESSRTDDPATSETAASSETTSSSEEPSVTSSLEHDAGIEDLDASASSSDSTGVAVDDTSRGDTTSAPAPTTEPKTDATEPPDRDYLPCDIELIIASRCRVCHGQSGNGQEPLLDTWGEVSSQAELIVEVVLDDYMPMLPPPLTEEQKASLEAWAATGAPPVRRPIAPVCP